MTAMDVGRARAASENKKKNDGVGCERRAAETDCRPVREAIASGRLWFYAQRDASLRLRAAR